MTISARRTSAASDHRFTIRRVRIAGLLASIACALALVAVAPAAAEVTEIPGGTKVGIQPRTQTLVSATNEAEFANNNGNTVVDGSIVYPIYWDPSRVFMADHHEWLTKLNAFFQQLGAGSGELETVFAPLGQYRDRANEPAAYSTVFMGSYTDSTAFPASGCTDPNPLEEGAEVCLTDAQLRAQLQSFVAEHELPKGMHSIFYLITPPGVTVCLEAAAKRCSDFTANKAELESEKPKSTSFEESFCSYHGDINPDSAAQGDANTILYAAIPWTAAGNLGNFFQFPSARLYAEGFPCQDGGWDPSGHKETFEKAVLPSQEEAEILAEEKHTEAERKALEKQRGLEGPHNEEPNQEAEGKGEVGDFSAGLADPIVNQVAEEQANIVTDPLLSSWHDPQGLEVTDECRNTFANTVGDAERPGFGGTSTAIDGTEAGTLFNQQIAAGDYYINNVFSSASGANGHCVGGVGMVPRFTAPNPVNSGEIVGFNGTESTVGLFKGLLFGPTGPPSATYATFTWNFGDGTEVTGFASSSPPCESPNPSPCAASVYHSYKYGGVYKVSLTITDVSGNKSSIVEDVHVAGPVAPGASPSGVTPTPSDTTQTTQAPGTASSLLKPVATAALVSRKLPTALSKGFVVSYSVNEQVAGHVELLLSRTQAKHLGIGGASATGLAPGSAPQVVLAKAIVITTKGGHGTLSLSVSKKTAQRLRRLHKLSVMVRLYVRTASKLPTTATVLSTGTLRG